MDRTLQAVTIFDKLANDYQCKFMDVSMYAESLDLFCSLLKKENATLLELACGPGNITKYLLTKRPDLDVYGIDLSPNMIQLAKENNPQASFDVMDCRDVKKMNRTFDAIVSGFCTPYLSKQETITLIKEASSLLTEQGLFYLSTMEDDNSNSGFEKGSSGDEIFMNYHEAVYLTQAFEESQLRILYIDRLQYIDHHHTPTTDLIIIAGKS